MWVRLDFVVNFVVFCCRSLLSVIEINVEYLNTTICSVLIASHLFSSSFSISVRKVNN